MWYSGRSEFCAVYTTYYVNPTKKFRWNSNGFQWKKDFPPWGDNCKSTRHWVSKNLSITLDKSIWKLIKAIRDWNSINKWLWRSCVKKEAAKRAGISEKTGAYWLRHCHASHALNRGAPIHLLSQTLGHASVATTSKYLHAKPNDSSGLYLVM